MKRFERFLPAIAIACALAVTACQRESAPASASTPTTPAATAPRSSGPTSNAFDVEITLSRAAREHLVAQRESLIAGAEYFGYPSARAQEAHVPGSENPWLTLHREQIELEGAQLDGTPTARFPAVTFDPEQLAWTEAPDAPQVNINVYSGRRSSPDNMLECGMFQDTLAVAARTPIRLSCGLIGEVAR